MAMIVVHHCPWQAERRSAVSLFLLAMLVSPVSNGPTDALVIILAILSSVGILTVSWLDKLVGESCRRTFLSLLLGAAMCVLTSVDRVMMSLLTTNRRAAGTSGADDVCIEFADRGMASTGQDDSPVCGLSTGLTPIYDSNEEGGDEEICDSGVGDHEAAHLLRSNQRGVEPHSSSNHRCGAVDSVLIGNKEEQYVDRESPASSLLKDLWMTVLGVFMVITAFIFYIGQNRTNYWMSHGLWHACAMGSTYFFIRNRESVVSRLTRIVCCCAKADTATSLRSL